MFKGLLVVCLAATAVLAQNTCTMTCDRTGVTALSCASLRTAAPSGWNSACIPNGQDAFCDDNPCNAGPLNTKPCNPRIYKDDAFTMRKCTDLGQLIDALPTACQCDASTKPADVNCTDATGFTRSVPPRCVSTTVTGSNTATCKWESFVCPASCPICSNQCTNGFVRDSNTGCPIRNDVAGTSETTCKCNPEDPCVGKTCPSTGTCPYGVRLSADRCCPECIPECDRSLCPEIRCTADEYVFSSATTCCPVCRPIDPCMTATGAPLPCTGEPTSCPTGEERVREGCCFICQKRTDCATLTSFAPCPSMDSCDLRTHKIVQLDGACCPRCIPLEICAGTTCTTATNACPNGTKPTYADGSCCPRCQPLDRCEGVACPANIACTFTYMKKDACCPTCVYCRAEINATTGLPIRVCDNNDDLKCAAGYTNDATGVCVPTDPTTRDTRTIKIVVKPNADGSCPDPEVVKRRLTIANQASLDPLTIHVSVTVERVERNGETWCVYEVTITYKKNTNDSNGNTFNTGVSNTESAIQGDSGMALYTGETPMSPNEDSAASTLVASLALIAGAVLLA